MGTTVHIMKGYTVTEHGHPCRSPNGEHVFAVGEIKCRYCSAERYPRGHGLGFDEDHRVGPSREGGSIKRSHRAEGRNWVD